jgi:hypothetical protein
MQITDDKATNFILSAKKQSPQITPRRLFYYVYPFFLRSFRIGLCPNFLLLILYLFTGQPNYNCLYDGNDCH